MGNQTSIDDYIRSLKYDKRQLLSTVADGATVTLKDNTRKESGGAVIICKYTKKEANGDFDKLSLVNAQDVIYPGALIYGDGTLAEGKPRIISIPRASLKLSVNLPGANNESGSTVIDNPQLSDVRSGVNTMLDKWLNENPDPDNRDSYVNSANLSYTYSRMYTQEQLAISLGFNAEWASGSGAVKAAMKMSSEKEVTVAIFDQIYYRINADAPTSRASYFASTVSLDDVKREINSNEPPAYVSSVAYGRKIMIRMETSKSAASGDLEAAMSYAAGTNKVNADLKASYEKILNNSKFTVYILGGSANSAKEVSFTGTDLQGLQKMIYKDLTYRKDNPGEPLYYVVRYLKNNEVANVYSSTTYIEETCTSYPMGFVKLRHSGGYIGKFKVTWQVPDANGNMHSKVYESGNKTAGFSHTIPMPGDATNIRIIGWAKTGLVWDMWPEAMNVSLGGPDNCTYVIHGTTLNRKYSKEDCPKG